MTSLLISETFDLIDSLHSTGHASAVRAARFLMLACENTENIYAPFVKVAREMPNTDLTVRDLLACNYLVSELYPDLSELNGRFYDALRELEDEYGALEWTVNGKDYYADNI